MYKGRARPYQGSALPLSYSSSGRAYAKDSAGLQPLFGKNWPKMKSHEKPEQTTKLPERFGNFRGRMFSGCSAAHYLAEHGIDGPALARTIFERWRTK